MVRYLLSGAAALSLAASPVAAQSAAVPVDRAAIEAEGLALTGGGPAVLAAVALALVVALIATTSDDDEAVSP